MVSLWRWDVSGAGLFRDAAQDLVALSVSAAILLVAAMAAVHLPTRRASRLDPASVLRQS